MSRVTGEVGVVNKNDKGFFSIKLENDDRWFGAGKYPPKCNKGDVVSFEVEERDYNGRTFYNAVTKTLKVETAAAQAPASTGGAVGADRQDSIIMQSANQYATEFLSLAVAADALPPLGTAKTKPADKFEALQALHTEIQLRFFNRAKFPQKFIEASKAPEPEVDDGPPEPDY